MDNLLENFTTAIRPVILMSIPKIQDRKLQRSELH